MHYFNIVFSVALSLIATATVHAQNKDPSDPNSPVSPVSSVTSASYQSTFSDYYRYQDPDIVSWKGANDEVGQSVEHGSAALKPMPAHKHNDKHSK